MLIEAVKTVTTLVQRRFLLNALLPSLIFWLGLSVVFWEGQGGLQAAIAFWDRQDSVLKVIEIVAAVAWIWLFAGVVASQWSTLIAVYSGRWPLPSFLASMLGGNCHQARVQKLQERVQERTATEGEKDTLSLHYDPDGGEIAPTLLGNIQISAEVYVLNRYRVDWNLLWPRLYPLLPQSFLGILEERRAGLELTIVASALSAAFGLLAGVYLFVVHADAGLFLLCFWGGMTVAIAMQVLSTSRALNYAETLRMAFDLYRHDLRKQFGGPSPEDLAGERRLWSELKEFIETGGEKAPIAYADEQPGAASNNGSITWPALVVWPANEPEYWV
jgi:hypothetical protein